eukprot:321335_1
MSRKVKSTEQTNPNDIIIIQNEHQMAMDTLTGRIASINAMENGKIMLLFLLIFWILVNKRQSAECFYWNHNRNSNLNGSNSIYDHIIIHNGKMHVIWIGKMKKIQNDINKNLIFGMKKKKTFVC